MPQVRRQHWEAWTGFASELLHLGDPVLIQITNSEFYSEVPVTSMLEQPFLNQFKQMFKYCPEVYSFLVTVRREKAFITIMFFI